MKVVSFNIRSASDPNGHSFDERAPRMKKVIDRIDPDLIGFQEVVPGWMKHIPEDYSEKYEIFHKYRCETFDIEGCTILWKKDLFECIEKGYFWLSDTPNIVSRGVVYVRESENLMEEAQQVVEAAVDKCMRRQITDWSKIKGEIRDSLSEFLWKKMKRSPMILPIIMEI